MTTHTSPSMDELRARIAELKLANEQRRAYLAGIDHRYTLNQEAFDATLDLKRDSKELEGLEKQLAYLGQLAKLSPKMSPL